MLNSYELSVLASVAGRDYHHDMLTLDRLKDGGYIRGNLLTLRFDVTDKGRAAIGQSTDGTSVGQEGERE